MSELRTAIAERLEAGRELGLLIDAMPGALQRLRPDGAGGWSVVFTSRSFATLLGLDDSEACTSLHETLTPAHAATLVACQNEALAKGEALCEIEVNCPGDRRVMLRGAMRLNPRGDHVPEIIVVWTDITEERNRRVHLAHADRLSTLGEMAAGLAHELNQPLSAIIVLADLVSLLVERGDAPAEDIVGKVERIAAMAERAGKIIQNLRNFARHATGTNGPVSLSNAVDSTRAMVGRLIEADGIQIEVTLPPNLPAVYGEITQIEQVLVNLLINARDAAVTAKRRGARIAISATHEQGGVSLHVADNAGGINPVIQGRLFEPFFTTKGSASGTGLGLSIARSAMNAMNGAITVRNAADGAVFTLHFKTAS